MVHEVKLDDSDAIRWPPSPMECKISETDTYEILLEDRYKTGPNGEAKTIRVFHLSHASPVREEISMRLTFRAWCDYFFKGIGGDLWPPRGEDMQNASIKNGRLTFRYSTIFQPNRDGSVSCWEAEYWPARRRWTVRFLEFQ